MNMHAPCPANPCYRLDQLSDSDLLASTRTLVGRSNRVLAALLAHLAEVEARGIHRARACAAGEIHLTAVLMLGPHLTEENHLEVLARAKHRTKKEISRLVRLLDPLPAVPARIEPLGPAPKGLKAPSWDRFASALCGPVRELAPGERPKAPAESPRWRGSSSPTRARSESPRWRGSVPTEPMRETVHQQTPLFMQAHKAQALAMQLRDTPA